MTNRDARLSADFPSHPKVLKVEKKLGGDGAWALVKLLCWAAANRTDGSLAGLSGEDIEIAIRWHGEDGAFIRTALSVRFLDGDEGQYQIHDWSDHQPWLAGFEQRSAKGRWNAIKGKYSEQEADRRVPEYAAVRTKKAATSSTGSKLAASSPASSALLLLQEQEPPIAPLKGGPAVSSTAAAKKMRRPRKASGEITIEEFMSACKEAGEKPIPKDGRAFTYAESNGIPEPILELAWREFKANYAVKGKRQKGVAGWRQTFANCVVGNWYRLWDLTNGFKLTSQGAGLYRERTGKDFGAAKMKGALQIV